MVALAPPAHVDKPSPDLRNPATWPFSDYDEWYAERDLGGTDPLPTREDAVRAAREISLRAQEFFGGELIRVWLHGSRARGDHTPGSDLDLIAEQRCEPDTGYVRTWYSIKELGYYLWDMVCEDQLFVNTVSIAEGRWEHPEDVFLRAVRKYAIRVL